MMKNIKIRSEERHLGVAEAKRLISNINSNKLKNLLQLTQKMIYLKTERVDVYSYSYFLILNLVEEIRQRLKMPYSDFFRLAPDEIMDLLKNNGKVEKKELIKRNNYAVIFLNGKMNYFYGKSIKKFIKASTMIIVISKKLVAKRAIRELFEVK